MGGRGFIFLAGTLAAGLAMAAPASAASIEVTTTNDELDGAPDATCSLREAVQSANQNFATGGCSKGQANKTDVIDLSAEVYELDIPTTDDGLNVNGDLDIGSGGDITIRGTGSDETQISTSLDDRIIEFNAFDQVLALERLEVTGGFAADNTPDSGGNVYAAQGKLKMKNVLSSNSFAAVGGAIALESGSTGQLKDTTVTGAGAELEGGAIELRNGGKLTIKRSTFEGNEVDQNADIEGGAIRTREGKLVISDSAFIDNKVTAGGSGNDTSKGAIFAGHKIDIKRSLFSGNTANGPIATANVSGGAIHYLAGENSKIVNSTFFDNDTGESGGAIFTNAGKLEVIHSSFLANDGPEGGHLYEGGLGVLTVRNSILATPLLGPSCGATSVLGTVKSLGYNVFDDETAACPSKAKDKVVNDVGFDSATPEDNGGPTETIGLLKTSKAVDLVPEKKCEKLDQRGFERPKGPKCDAGAVERGAKP